MAKMVSCLKFQTSFYPSDFDLLLRYSCTSAIFLSFPLLLELQSHVDWLYYFILLHKFLKLFIFLRSFVVVILRLVLSMDLSIELLVIILNRTLEFPFGFALQFPEILYLLTQ